MITRKWVFCILIIVMFFSVMVISGCKTREPAIPTENLRESYISMG